MDDSLFDTALVSPKSCFDPMMQNCARVSVQEHFNPTNNQTCIYKEKVTTAEAIKFIEEFYISMFF